MIDGAMLQAQPEELREEIARALRSGQIALALLAEFDFASGPARLCNWVVPVTDGRDGHQWLPLGIPGGWRDIEGGPRNLAPLRIYFLTVPLAIARQFSVADTPVPDLTGKEEYHDRTATLSLQILQPGRGANGEAAPLGYPIVLHSGRMDRTKVRVTRTEVVHELHVEGALARRRVPGNGKLTPRDQKARHPGDLGLDHVTEIPVRPARWPNY